MIRFFVSIWLRNLYPIWNAIPSTIQAFLSSDAKKKGQEVLRQLGSLAPDWQAISDKMVSLGFEWSQDPMGGALDFHQRSWITAATGKGDCDDWAYVWRELAKPFGDVYTFVAKKKGGGWHMMTILDNGVKAHLFSNLLFFRTTSSTNRKALETTLYGYDKTAYVVYLR